VPSGLSVQIADPNVASIHVAGLRGTPAHISTKLAEVLDVCVLTVSSNIASIKSADVELTVVLTVASAGNTAVAYL